MTHPDPGARDHTPPGTDVLLVRLGGNAASVAAQRDALGGERVPDDVWTALREVEPSGAPVWRWFSITITKAGGVLM